jgi:signal-transduction protein with cAMP-binding, CBS, and nucleotidyltransferase domain
MKKYLFLLIALFPVISAAQTKVAAAEKQSINVKVRDICTYSPKVLVAKVDDTLETCMSKMLFKNIRHLLIYDKTVFVGLISIKDLIRLIFSNNKLIF